MHFWPTNLDHVIFNTSGSHGVFTFQFGSSFCLFADFYHLIFQKEWEREGVIQCNSLILTPAPAVEKKGREGERKATVDHMSSWLSNSKLKRGAISWGPISRQLVLSVGVTPLGGGRGGGCYSEKERERERKGKLYTDCHITVCEREIV